MKFKPQATMFWVVPVNEASIYCVYTLRGNEYICSLSLSITLPALQLTLTK